MAPTNACSNSVPPPTPRYRPACAGAASADCGTSRGTLWATDTLKATPRLRDSRTSICTRSEEHTSELQSRQYLVCRLLLEKKNNQREPATQHPGKAPGSHGTP